MGQRNGAFFDFLGNLQEKKLQFGRLELSPVLFLTLVFFSVVGFVQIIFTQVISLNGGLGYDGFWYIRTAIRPFSGTDNYHIFRQLPSFLVWVITYIQHTLQLHRFVVVSEIRSFQMLNLASILISCWYLDKLSGVYGFSGLKKVLFFTLSLGSFCFIRDAFFNPVMTDTFSWMQIVVLIYLMAKKRNGPLFYFICLTALFTNPFPVIILTLTEALKNMRFKASRKQGVNLFPVTTALAVAFLYGFICYSSTVAKGIYSFYKYPDEAIPGLMLPIILLHSFLMLLLIYFALLSFRLPNLLKELKKLNYYYAALFLTSILIIKLISNNYPEKFYAGTDDPFLVMAIWSNIKPLIGFIDSTSYFGLLIPLFLVCYRKAAWLLVSEYGFGGMVFLGTGLLFLMKSESRHALVFIPILSMAVIKTLPTAGLRLTAFFLLLNLFLSKIWYPLQLADFTNGEYQAYPAQHYFAFLGPTLAWWPYFLFLLIFLLIILTLYLVLKARNSNKQFNVGRYG